MRNALSQTTLGDFSRSLRDEPYYLVYRHKIYVERDEVLADEVVSWLKKRYADTRRGNRYRIVTYLHTNGFRYVDYILMETVKDADRTYMQLRWGFSQEKVKRGDRVPRRRLNSDQRKLLNARIAAVTEEFWEMVDRDRPDRVQED